MEPERIAERMMRMDAESWARHANPWSVWTRVLTPLPLLSLAIASRVWIGWSALAALALVCLWIWWNPRAFAAPKSLESWASRGVLGERVYLHHRDQVAAHHLAPARALMALSGLGMLPWIWGLWALDFWAICAGIAIIVLGKMWFVDRCAWIWQDWLEAGRGPEDLTQ